MRRARRRAAVLVPVRYLLWSLRYGAVAPANPWGATGIEWQTPSPPPTENFDRTPFVAEDAYAYPLKVKEAPIG